MGETLVVSLQKKVAIFSLIVDPLVYLYLHMYIKVYISKRKPNEPIPRKNKYMYMIYAFSIPIRTLIII